VPYKDLTPKQRRIVDTDVKTLFTSREILTGQPIDHLGSSLDFLHPWRQTVKGSAPLSSVGVAALKRISETVTFLVELKGKVSAHEIADAVFDGYTAWVEREGEPTGEEFVFDTLKRLTPTIKEYEFLVPIEGLSLGEIGTLDLGTIRIQPSDRALFDQIGLGDFANPDRIYKQMGESSWMLGAAIGSPEIATEQFEQRVTLTVGILAICGALLYKGALRRSRVRPIMGPFDRRQTSVMLRWDAGGGNAQITYSGGGIQDLSLDTEQVKYLTDTCRLKEMTALIVEQSRSEIGEAVIRALYWFADAHIDRNCAMRLTKLWTCAESFFSLEKDRVTELNVSGIASILVFSGFQIVEFKDYGAVKKRLKALYDLRSRTLHRAEYDQISAKDIDELSHWLAWVIVSMMTLMERGYRSLAQVREQCERLDSTMSSSARRSAQSKSTSKRGE